MLRWLTAGESHGPLLVAILEGLPAHVSITTDDLREALARRRLGHGRGARMKFEQDDVRFVGGVRHGETIGGPGGRRDRQHRVAQVGPGDVGRPDRPGRARRAGPQRAADPAAARARRPGGHAEVRLRRGPARPRARVGPRDRGPRRAGSGRDQLPAAGRRRDAWSRHVVELGGVPAPAGLVPTADDVAALDDDPVRCLDPTASEKMVAAIDQAHKDGDTLGGVVEVVVHGLPPGLGSHVHWDRRIDARLAGALMGIQAIKGVEVGDGFELAATPGSRAHDEIVPTDDGIRRVSGRSGGTEGGMTTGEVLRVRAAMKPIATVPRALRTVDVSHRRGGRRPPPALRRVRRPRRRHRRRGDGRAGARRRGAGEVRRRRRHRDPPQRRELPRHAEVQVTVTRPVVVLVGPMGAGKTTVAALLADRLGHVRARHRRRRRGAPRAATISDIFVDSGEEHFRALERAAVERAVAEHDGVLALGGGAVLDPATRDAAGRPPRGVPAGRPLRGGQAGRPRHARPLLLGNVRGRIKALLDERTPIYESVATETVDTDGRTPEEVADEILRKVAVPSATAMSDARHDAPRRRRVAVRRGGRPRPARPAARGAGRGARAGGSRAPRAAGRAGPPGARPSCVTATCCSLPVPDGEEAKTAAVAARCWEALGQAGFTRSDAVVTLGGGATTDLGGFVAATWLRGVRVVHLPDQPARDGRRRRRRQDRHQHRRGQEPRRLVPRAGRRALRPGPARHPARARSWSPASARWSSAASSPTP